MLCLRKKDYGFSALVFISAYLLVILLGVFFYVDSGSINSIPLVSQIKSAVQAIAGDDEGARRTQIDFLNKCLVVSQFNFLLHGCQGDDEAARRTNEQCGGDILDFVKGFGYGTPLVGHAIGGILKAAGNDEEADQAFKASSRTIGVIGGGVAGCMAGGPIGAIAGGIAGGAAMDGLITGCDKAINGKGTPSYGCIRAWEQVAVGDAGSGFDAVIGHVADGYAGYGCGRGARKIQRGFNEKRLYRVAAADAVSDHVCCQTIELKSLRLNAGPSVAPCKSSLRLKAKLKSEPFLAGVVYQQQQAHSRVHEQHQT